MTLTGAGLAVTEIVAEADFVGSDTDVAVRVTPSAAETTKGAVYVMAAPEALTVLEIVPHAVPTQAAPESVQVTPLF